MTEYRRDLPERPDRIKALPIDDRGYPVPFFVSWLDGKPDFRCADVSKWLRCYKERLCWVCGQRLGRHLCFPIGPMCAVNRTTSEPPCHLECGLYSVAACPFLVRPTAKRRDANLPADSTEPAGVMLHRNPGVTLLWMTREYQVFRAGGDGNDGYLIQLGEPDDIRCYAQGRKATWAEIMASIDSGMPELRRVAEQESVAAEQALARFYVRAIDSLKACGGFAP